jgi:hypothetical protein
MVIALFGTWEAFWSAYRSDYQNEVPRRASDSSLHEFADTSSAKVNARRTDLLSRIDAGMSVTAAAAAVGIATGTAMAWAAKAAVTVARRPKFMKPDVRKQVIRALRRGIDKAVIAKSYGISIQTVTTTLRTAMGLADAWHGVRFMQAMRRARADWTAIAARHPHATYTDIRRMAPAAFAWLYRNDRAWLEERAKRQPSCQPCLRLRNSDGHGHRYQYPRRSDRTKQRWAAGERVPRQAASGGRSDKMGRGLPAAVSRLQQRVQVRTGGDTTGQQGVRGSR